MTFNFMAQIIAKYSFKEKFTPSLFDLDPIFLHPFLILKPSPKKKTNAKHHPFPDSKLPEGGEP